MIYLQLFLEFLKIGAVSFGGGYAMIPLIQDTVLYHNWLSEQELLNFIAISESTPGPIAINISTFIGYSQGGILGSIFATIGVILPALIIIITISIFIKNILSITPVQYMLNGIKPVVVALILSTAINLGLLTIINISSINSTPLLDLWAIVILAVITITHLIYKNLRKKKLSPIVLILISGVLGIIVSPLLASLKSFNNS